MHIYIYIYISKFITFALTELCAADRLHRGYKQSRNSHIGDVIADTHPEAVKSCKPVVHTTPYTNILLNKAKTKDI